MEIVFVYGTLKKAHGNHRLIHGSKYVGTGLTKDKFVMYEDGIPYVSKRYPSTNISGELYQVSKATLADLDMLEGHPIWYKREKTLIKVIDKNNNIKLINAWLYFNEMIPSGAKINNIGIYGYKEKSKFISLLHKQENQGEDR